MIKNKKEYEIINFSLISLLLAVIFNILFIITNSKWSLNLESSQVTIMMWLSFISLMIYFASLGLILLGKTNHDGNFIKNLFNFIALVILFIDFVYYVDPIYDISIPIFIVFFVVKTFNILVLLFNFIYYAKKNIK